MIILTGLKILELSYNSVGPAGVELLLPSVMALTGLHTLDLLDYTSARDISSAAMEQLLSLTGMHSLRF